MVHTYEEAIDWVHARLRLGIKPGLERMMWMMERLGHPERNLKAIHIAGTNGKGSTVTYVREILQQSGYSVGTFTSPFIETFNERISVNGVPISDEAIVQLVNDLIPLADELEQTEYGPITEFELLTVMCYHYFGNIAPQDIVVIEVGLGGRLDCTNIIVPIMTAITSIGLDHIAILGETKREIAYEKAGIIKRNIPMVTAVREAEPFEEIDRIATLHDAPLDQLSREFTITDDGETFTYQSTTLHLSDILLKMKGKHQQENAAVAIRIIERLRETGAIVVSDEAIRCGLQQAVWIGRFEVMSDKPTIIVDGAHNREGVEALIATLQRHYSQKTIRTIFCAMVDKPFAPMIEQLATISASLHYVPFDFPRAATPEQLLAATNGPASTFATLEEAIQSLANEQDVLVITGSLYFIASARPIIQQFV